MKASELRIGNLLQKSNGQIFTVSRLDNTNDVQVLEERGLLTLGYNLFGIPLTEENLLKFGFQKEGKTIFFLDIGQNLRFCIPIANTDKKIYFEINQYDWNSMEGNYCEFFTNCLYVHQLQNLYFALTGEELIIKDDVGN